MLPLLALGAIAGGAGTAAQVGSNIGRSIQEEKYRKEVEAYKDELDKMKRKQQYRSALARAMGGTDYIINKEPEAPEAPNTMWWDILGATGGGLKGAGQMATSAGMGK